MDLLLPFYPMIATAWSDGYLSPEEILRIRSAAERANWLDPAAKEALHAWLDPEHPPSARKLAELERDMRAAVASVAPNQRRSLVALGGELARLAAPEEKWDADHLHEVLAATESALYGAALATYQTPAPRPTAQGADGKTLTALLDGDYAAARQDVRQLLSEPALRFNDETDTEKHRAQVLTWLIHLAEHGLGEKAFPDVLKRSRDLGEFIAAFETLGHFDLSLMVKFGVQFGLFGGAIYNLGMPAHHALLPKVARAELLGCFAMTERGHGSNVRDLRTVARYEPSEKAFVLHSPDLGAGKEWIGGAARDAKMAVVFAQLETLGENYGVHAWLVPIRDDASKTLPGVRIEDCGRKMGLNGVDNGRLWFDNLRVPRANLLDRFGQVSEAGEYTSKIASSGKRFFTMLGTLVGGRISVSGAATATAKTGLAIAVRYGEARRQFSSGGDEEIPIFDYLSHQQRLLPRIAAAYAMSFAQQTLVHRFANKKPDDEREGREIEALAAGLKALSTWNAIETLQACRECCGGQGYLTANRIDALRTDSDVFTTFEGDNTVLLELVAKSVLGAYSKQFHDNGLLMVLRALGQQVQEKIPNPFASLKDDKVLLDPAFHLAAFKHREESLVASASRRLKKRVDQGMDATAAFNACLDHMLALARAAVERQILEAFQAKAKDGVVKQLCQLWAVWRIEDDLAWFMERGDVPAGKARALRKALLALQAELKPQARTLVDAFAIPESCLGPLADIVYLQQSGLAQQSDLAR